MQDFGEAKIHTVTRLPRNASEDSWDVGQALTFRFRTVNARRGSDTVKWRNVPAFAPTPRAGAGRNDFTKDAILCGCTLFRYAGPANSSKIEQCSSAIESGVYRSRDSRASRVLSASKLRILSLSSKWLPTSNRSKQSP
jgi:hypothetical protein